MSERIDKEYLKPQIKIMENALIEWSVICIVFFSKFILELASEDPSITNFLCIFVVFYAVFGSFYVVVRTAIPSYFAFRKVVMAEDDK